MNSSGEFLNGSRAAAVVGLLPLGKGGQASGQCRQRAVGSFGASEAEIHSWEKQASGASTAQGGNNQAGFFSALFPPQPAHSSHIQESRNPKEPKRYSAIYDELRNYRCSETSRPSNRAIVRVDGNRQTIEPSP